jgi:hypothetical protein
MNIGICRVWTSILVRIVIEGEEGFEVMTMRVRPCRIRIVR